MPTVDADDILIEFCDYAGIADDRAPELKDFPNFIRFLEARYPDFAGCAFLIWR